VSETRRIGHLAVDDCPRSTAVRRLAVATIDLDLG
jgi:hypothetical protein